MCGQLPHLVRKLTYPYQDCSSHKVVTDHTENDQFLTVDTLVQWQWFCLLLHPQWSINQWCHGSTQQPTLLLLPNAMATIHIHQVFQSWGNDSFSYSHVHSAKHHIRQTATNCEGNTDHHKHWPEHVHSIAHVLGSQVLSARVTPEFNMSRLQYLHPCAEHCYAPHQVPLICDIHFSLVNWGLFAACDLHLHWFLWLSAFCTSLHYD